MTQYSHWPLLLTLPPHILLFFFVLAVDSFLIVLPLSEIVTLCCARSIYVFHIKLHEMHLQVILKKWFIFV